MGQEVAGQSATVGRTAVSSEPPVHGTRKRCLWEKERQARKAAKVPMGKLAVGHDTMGVQGQ